MFLSLEELSTKLNLPRTYLRQLADAGTIPCLRPGGRRRFDTKAVGEALSRLAAQGERGGTDCA